MEQIFSRLDALQDSGGNYPPYNIVNREEGVQELEIALAGWSRDDIEVITERNVLTVSATREGTDSRVFTHKGISTRTFAKNWQLSDDVTVDKVSYQDGLLTIRLVKEIPEAQQRKVLPIS
jgi:molecular chaperone IbpA